MKVLLARYLGAVCLALLLGISGIPVVAFMAGAGGGALVQSLQWFDALFLQYNLVLLLLTQISVPLLTYLYVNKMRGEKEQRLRRELPAAQWTREEPGIRHRLQEHFRFQNYLGSVLLVLAVVTLGMSIILLLKPVSSAAIDSAGGVNYQRGANFLLLGPVIELPPSDPAFYHRVILSLTAFQFGFLGGYIYFIGHLVRSYFTLDLTPHTYVDSVVRMGTAAVLSLVVSFVLPTAADCEPGHPTACMSVPLVSFALGYFPARALLFIEKAVTRLIQVGGAHYNSTPLSSLSGMSYAHELRLDREGYDSVENLTHADPLDLAIRTGFGYRQLRHWIGEAWLRTHLGPSYDAFTRRTGLATRDDVEAFLEDWEATKRAGDVTAHLSGGVEDLAGRVDGACALLRHARAGN